MGVLVARGAEAELRLGEWMGRRVLVKHRVPKDYRREELDNNLRSQRIVNEARLMAEARRAGVAVPILYDIDLVENKIVMEFIEGPRLKDVVEERGLEARAYCRDLGRLLGRLHARDLVHGDLTTSNVLLRDGRLVLIDFSLGGKARGDEEKGVDLRLAKEAFTSAHSRFPDLLQEFFAGYRETYDGAPAALAKLAEIEGRRRYA